MTCAMRTPVPESLRDHAVTTEAAFLAEILTAFGRVRACEWPEPCDRCRLTAAGLVDSARELWAARYEEHARGAYVPPRRLAEEAG